MGTTNWDTFKTTNTAYFPVAFGSPAWLLNTPANVWDSVLDQLNANLNVTQVNPGYSIPLPFTLTPGGSCSAGVSKTITFSPSMACPLGVNGSDTGHYVRLSIPSEVVLITGGTAVSGGTSGTLTFTPASNHSGAWTITSASGGVQEGLIATPACPLSAIGSFDFYAPVKLPTSHPGIIGGGQGATFFRVNFTTGDVITTSGTIALFQDLEVVPVSGVMTSGSLINAAGEVQLERVNLGGAGADAWIGISGAGGAVMRLSHVFIVARFEPVHGVNVRPEFTNVHVANSSSSGTVVSSSKGLYLAACAGGFINGYIDDGGYFTVGVMLDTTNVVGTFCNELGWNNIYFDHYRDFGLYVLGTNPAVSHELSNFRFNDDNGSGSNAIGMYFPAGAKNWTIGIGTVGFAGNGRGVVVEGASYINWDNVMVYPISNGGGNVAFLILSNAASKHISVTGSHIGIGVDNSGNPANAGFINQNTSLDTLTLVGNVFRAAASSNALVLTGTETNALVASNPGLSLASLASASTLAIPFVNDGAIITVTGTTAVTAVSQLRAGQFGFLLFTNAAPGAWSAGSTIGTAGTPTQNKLVHFSFDGTKIYLAF